MSGVRFKETQRFNQLWLWIIIVITGIPIYLAVFRQVIFNQPIGVHPASDSIYISFFCFHLLITLLLLIIKLEVEISTRHISYKFFPFHFKRKRVPISLVQSAYIREYHPIKELSALGVNLGKHSKAYNIKGFWGIQLEFQGGRQLLLGTQNPDELNKVLKQLQIPEE